MSNQEYYKNLIIRMAKEIEDEDYLSKIYHYAIVKYRKERERSEGQEVM